SGLDANQLVEVAIESNPQIHLMRAQWDAANHQILQNYAPADPVFTYSNVDAAHGLLDEAASHSHQLSENFQFPGKAELQAQQARGTAKIARFAYEAAIRDLRANVETGYYQILLDDALLDVNSQNIENLHEILKVSEIAYSASQVSQTDFILAEVNLAQAEQQQRQYRVNKANDETNLNQLLYRDADSPLNLDRSMRLTRLNLPLQTAVDMAYHARQEILEAALTERNQNTALELAKMEYLPDYQVAYSYDQFLQSGAQPLANVTHGNTLSIGFNVPIFFWIHQNEDVKAAQYSLEAARSNLQLIRSQTAAAVTQLFRTTQFAYESAQLYKQSLIPLANQDFRVGLIAYQSSKIDFLTLSAALQASYTAQTSYLQSANQFLAGRVALEQAIGAPLPQ
ncbi:MAG TPA: TolC family protein, partial [Candidatus Binataceae bacterium]|nr:TolC family protein [Candidatus Binataceae bacterium]